MSDRQRPTVTRIIPLDTAQPEPPALPTRYLTPEDIASMFSLPSVETVYQWRRKHTGPPGFRVGRHLRYDPAAVAAWVAQQSDQAA
ncbi:helix-turn-helix domain-containing protein [Kitasatospora sp. NPDC006697]|uniref:helix-turn-helix domain-containing protein n=1 Tax=Kitasatospora sp. NPDC006697 TaxID=3364020 RepID=UPI0036CF5D1F